MEKDKNIYLFFPQIEIDTMEEIEKERKKDEKRQQSELDP